MPASPSTSDLPSQITSDSMMTRSERPSQFLTSRKTVQIKGKAAEEGYKYKNTAKESVRRRY